MSERVRWLFFSPDDLPEPHGAFVYVDLPDGGSRLHACYARSQVRAVFDAAPATSADVQKTSFGFLERCGLPDANDMPEAVMHGWVADYMLDQFTGDDHVIEERDLDDFCQTESGYNFVTPVPGSGTEAVLAEFDPSGCRLWVMPSRAAARHVLSRVRAHASEELYEACLEDLDGSPLPEEDGERELVCIAGGLGAIAACVFYCNHERQARKNEDLA